jgi:hypothetical protein
VICGRRGGMHPAPCRAHAAIANPSSCCTHRGPGIPRCARLGWVSTPVATSDVAHRRLAARNLTSLACARNGLTKGVCEQHNCKSSEGVDRAPVERGQRLSGYPIIPLEQSITLSYPMSGRSSRRHRTRPKTRQYGKDTHWRANRPSCSRPLHQAFAATATGCGQKRTESVTVPVDGRGVLTRTSNVSASVGAPMRLVQRAARRRTTAHNDAHQIGSVRRTRSHRGTR